MKMLDARMLGLTNRTQLPSRLACYLGFTAGCEQAATPVAARILLFGGWLHTLHSFIAWHSRCK